MDSRPLKVLVVDDSALYRQTICNALREIGSVQVVGTAKDGHDALDKIKQLDPDVLTLDFEMPGLDGVQVLRRMSRRGVRAKAIMVSSYTEEGGKVTTDALMEGAFDFVLKPTKGTPDENRIALHAALLEKLVAIADTISQAASPAVQASSDPSNFRPPRRKRRDESKGTDAVVIGASTGGPIVLRKVLSALPGDFPVPVIVVQHMPEQFTAPLARRLNEVCELNVVETAEAQRIRAGGVYIAKGGKHTKIVRREKHVIVHLSDDPQENSCRPAVDYTLRSATNAYDGNVLAAILTGMGKDGVKGCEYLADKGGRVIAQSPEDCAVFGMPKAVIEQGLADSVVPGDRVAKAIQRILRTRAAE